jgi:isoquinoline 1-oxidoreductase subunit beta
MNNTVTNENRRKFLQSGAAAGGAFVLGLQISSKAEAVAVSHATIRTADFPGDAFAPNAWIRVAKDNKVSIYASRSEMGQGVYTAMPQLVAEEMEIDLNDLQVGIPPARPPYINRIFGAQLTGGSTSIRDSFTYLRQAGAAARIMFVNAAAKKWNVDASKLWAEKGHVMGPGGAKASYGSLVEAASQEQEPKDPALKDPSQWKIIGQPLRRFDSQYKVNGTAEFGIDVKVPGMLIAAVEMAPVIGGNVTGMDEQAAMASPGVKKIMKFSDTYTNGVACIADTFWNAKKGLQAAKVQFDGGKNAGLSSAKISSMLADGLKGESVEAKSRGDVAGAMTGAKIMSGEYELQFLCHSPMEACNATALVTDGKAEVWAPTQFQTLVPPTVAQVTGLKPEQVEVHTTFLGGGFGRKIEMDFIVQAAICANAMKGTPVKVIWSRENDMTNDSYRPVSMQRIDAAIDSNGYPTAWKYKIASPSITSRMFPGAIQKGVDPFMLEAAENFPYDVPNWNLSLTMVDTGQRVGYWRAVSNNLNAFAQEVFIDELAHGAGKDPVEYRRVLLRDKPRYLGVIDLAVAKSGYGKQLGAGRAHGVAVIECYETYGCLITEAEVMADGKIKLHKMTYAVDAGRLINPNISHQQIVSGVVSGLQNAFSEITVQGGAVQQTNFHQYYLPRMADVPQIDVHFVASDEKPGGLGEVGVPLVSPAISNAIFNATGKRIRKTPFKPGITA